MYKKQSIFLILFLIVQHLTIAQTKTGKELIDQANQYNIRLKLDSALIIADSVIALKKKENNFENIAQAFLIKSSVYAKRQKPKEADENLTSAYSYASICKSNDLWAKYYSTMGSNLSIAGNLEGTLSSYKKAIDYATLAGDSIIIRNANFRLGTSYLEYLKCDTALSYLMQSLKISIAFNDSDRMFQTYRMMGLCYSFLNYTEESYEIFLKTNEYIAASKSSINNRDFYYNAAIAAWETNHAKVAEKFTVDYININKKFTDDQGYYNEWNLKGLLFFHNKELDSAEFYLKKSYDLRQRNNGHFKIKKIFNENCIPYCNVLIENNKAETAISMLKGFEQVTNDYKSGFDKVIVYKLLAKAYIFIGNRDSANYYLNAFSQTNDSIYSIEKSRLIANLEVKFDIERKNQKIKELDFANDINSLNLKIQKKELNEQLLINANQHNLLLVKARESELKNALFGEKEAAIKAEQEKKQTLANAEIQKQKLVRNFSFIIIFVVILIGLYSFYRFRKNKQIENQQALLNERLRISRELHDDMGSTLSSISVYSEVAKNRASKNENETEVLQKIGNASRELIDKMSDIVWSLNPNNENFEQLKNRMMAFAAMMLTPKGIQFEFEIDDEVKSTAIAPEQRKNIFLIYKEAINNIVKYSKAKEVKVKVKVRPNVDSYGRVKENKLSLVIIDNGVGFDSLSFGEGRGEAYNGNGLKNMKARAEEIKALFNITSRINEGVKIELAFNI